MILDVCCGAMMMYHSRHRKLGDNFIYCDVRTMDTHYYHGRKDLGWKIQGIRPLVKADMRYLPFKDETFTTIICDPPHMDAAADSFMGQKYGAWNLTDIIRTLKLANVEFARVLKPDGSLLLKIFAGKLPVFERLLSNFIIYLPIISLSKSGHSKTKVGWYVGVLKDAAEITLELYEDVLPPRQVQQPLPQSHSRKRSLASFFESQP